MKINIKRESLHVEYDVSLQGVTLLEVLNEIKYKLDATLTFNSGCRSSVCGSCALRVNGREVLACSYKAEDGDVVEPLLNSPIERDLVVNMDKAYSFNAKAKAWQSSFAQHVKLTDEDEMRNALQSDCILCGSCYSACPVYEVNKEFLGPFSLTRVWRYVSDKREENPKGKIDNIQINGVWDCTLCNACTLVCPQGISSKADIEKLRARSVMFGYSDSSFANFGGGFSFDGTPSF
ncbi:Succinate dehydrogenase/fumarate reductase Fe-S protein subunit [Sulfurimonas denitrificans DSM 1251]|jgi:fumarate reductase iron-sulfur subunit|uniref:Fumarate reductase iron-sulfur subunit n=1 Tax=Sulfurimonas denitrificans (strain ATCC 33889 / DSM 1251) TaxID=326298 RepID=Q30UL2_SULDN|nr:2Fe-2S iron-sulfur cluster-binding protein [Sulfurimonas denitrificans]ABB43319.1 Succinate dehydrogenase/fumarate reductase Fe-S protein subunit [Sulfurimonas denitrificans DSM 1251]MDD3443356.1 2Fe-2S iron-sulfur cluster-binding protein [Sulfurimonas denitrificans]